MADVSRFIGIEQIAGLLYRYWRTLAAAIAAGILLMMMITFFMATTYEATMTLAPVQQDSSGMQGLSGLVSQFTGGGGGGAASSINQLTTMFTMPVVADNLDRRYGLMRKVVFRSQWDEKRKSWRQPFSLRAMLADAVLNLFGMSAWHEPSPNQLAAFIDGHLSTTTDKDTGMVTVTFRSPSGPFARDMLRMVYTEADRELREAERDRNRARIEYATSEMKNAQDLSRRDALSALLIQLERQNIQLNLDEPFAASLVQPPIIEDWPVAPRPFRMMGLGLLMGLVLGGVWIVAASWFGYTRFLI
jgi:hypothetical protein